MTEKEMKRLSRAELLELLLIQTRETERLKVKLEAARQQLANREIQIRESGSLAEAVLVVNGVVDAAQAAATQYLENIARMEAETQERCRRMLDEAKAEAERISQASQSMQSNSSAVAGNREGIGSLLEEAKQLIGLQE